MIEKHKYPMQHQAKYLLSNVSHEVLVKLPKEEHVMRTIRNHSGYNDPSKPVCRKELVISIYILYICFIFI